MQADLDSNLQQNIHGVSQYACLTELLHVPLHKRHVGFLIAKLLLMILDVLTGHRDLRRHKLNR